MAKAGEPPGRREQEELPDEAVGELAAGFGGELVRPGDEEYEEARQVWNGAINRYPALVARCSGVADVMAAVEFARERDLLVAVRGGAHNVAGNATCDGGVVVDLSAMDGVHVDPEARTVRVGGGAKWLAVDREAQAFGLATPGGVVSDTGVAGFTLNGGYGHLRRAYGLACDNLRSVDLVTADGEFVTASEDRNEDLFWALRGGGGNFGVVTSMEFALHPVGPEVATAFVWFPGEAIADGLRRFRELAADAPDEASVVAFTAYVPEMPELPESAWGDLALVVLGAHAGDPGDGEAALAPFREIADPVADLSGRMDYRDLQTLLDEDYPTGRQYYWKAVYLDELTDDVIDVVASTSEDAPSTLSTVDLWHLGGAISDVAPDETAFRHREESYMLTFEANWDDPAEGDANVQWARDGVAALRELPEVAGGYGNFPGFGEDPARTVFGDNYDRLVEVKDAYDPENLFRLNQNVEPSG